MENKMNLEIKNVSYRYREDGRQILENFSLTVSQKERVGLAAPSGYGKTTLCKLLSGYLKPDQGEILLEGMKKLGFFTFASEANYIFFKGPEDLQEKCLEKGIYIRDCSNYRGLKKGYYRVAVRTGEENEELLKVFKQILEQNR